MDYSKIRGDWVILLVIVACGIITAEIVRWNFMADGAETGTAWVFFFVSLILSAAVYFAIIRVMYLLLGPLVRCL